MLADRLPPKLLHIPKLDPKAQKQKAPSTAVSEPLSIKQIEPVGDYWLTANNCQMETFSFQVSSTQLTHLCSKIPNQNQTSKTPPFESLCAVIWQCLARVRENPEPRMVTVCRKGYHDKEDWILSNSQMLSIVKADFSVADANPSELATLLAQRSVEENSRGLSDFITLGVNLTFVNLEDIELFGLEIKGQTHLCELFSWWHR
ncbi:PREDICTED: protein ECERIFERUM 26-like [Nelumbo nucifera]|uniref:Protein ECERIFERUM 26-like n=2 Tax=Nelumbo nucifera TaxID=4432 RepID=A0A1U8Q4P8_NELNU|nr:PREDICTED: protein ECERIFERUM 26-like [Nelumbo nucifera]DAD40933.1 TPA_asm: hypothetical protein HUJ06_015256 [Nelumbo nucifera]